MDRIPLNSGQQTRKLRSSCEYRFKIFTTNSSKSTMYKSQKNLLDAASISITQTPSSQPCSHIAPPTHHAIPHPSPQPRHRGLRDRNTLLQRRQLRRWLTRLPKHRARQLLHFRSRAPSHRRLSRHPEAVEFRHKGIYQWRMSRFEGAGESVQCRFWMFAW